MQNRIQFPTAALDWMVPGSGCRILNLGGSVAVPRLLAARGHDVFSVHKDDATLASLAGMNTLADVSSSASLGASAGRAITVVGAQPEALPFQPCTFDVVVCHQVFSQFAPGLVLSEVARVLNPGGHFAVSLLARDDSVPWVRRLVARVRQVAPDAMAGDYGAASMGSLAASKYFAPPVEHGFRIWVPVSADVLVTMVTEALPSHDDAVARDLATDVRHLYAESASGSNALRLPYELRAWRAEVDHSELTEPITYDDSGLVIPI